MDLRSAADELIKEDCMKYYVLCGQLKWIGVAEDAKQAVLKALLYNDGKKLAISPQIFVSKHGFDWCRQEWDDVLFVTEKILMELHNDSE
jgi:hypothetical protein